MPDPKSDASKLAAQAKERATALAGQAAAAAGPLTAQAKERATALAGQAAAAAGPLTEQARVRAAQGVDVIAGNLDKITGGKYSDQIHSVAVRVGGVLDNTPKAAPEPPPASTPTTPPASTAPPTTPPTPPSP